MLKKYHSNPNAKNSNGLTPLQLAVSNYNLEASKLLKSVSNLREVDSNGNTLLHLATMNGKLATTQSTFQNAILNIKKKEKIIFDESCNDSHLEMMSQSKSDREKVRFIKELGSSPEDGHAVNGDGNTPLHTAVTGGNVAIVKYLVETLNADGFAKNKQGLTPLDMASQCQTCEIKKYLTNNIL